MTKRRAIYAHICTEYLWNDIKELITVVAFGERKQEGNGREACVSLYTFLCFVLNSFPCTFFKVLFNY